MGSKPRISMLQPVFSARRLPYGSIQAREHNNKIRNTAATASSIKSDAPNPSGFLSGRKERNRSTKNIASAPARNGAWVGIVLWAVRAFSLPEPAQAKQTARGRKG